MSEKKTTQSAPIQAGIVRGLVDGLARLSLASAQRLGAGLGLLFWLIPNRARAASRRNLARCLPELSARERKRLIRTSLISTGMNVAEAGAMWRWPAERLAELEERIDDEQLLRTGLARGKGVLLLAPHVGNWEFLCHFLSARSPFCSLYRPPRIAEVDEFIRQRRERHGARLVPATVGGLRRFRQALAAGHLAMILPDQEPLKRHGVFAPFFGNPALTMTLVGSLVQRFEPAVIYCFAQRTAGGAFRVRFLPAPEGLGDPDPVQAAGQLNLGVERCVQACPEQYMWSYRRFKTKPPGRPPDRLSLG